MKRVSFFLGWIFLLIVAVSAQDKIVKLKIVETSDIHGNYYPYDFILRHEAGGSLARIHAFVQKEREVYKDNLLLLDNGDILQGQPCAYYYNYIDTVSPHLAAEVLNYMQYNTGNMGNHDVETGRAVFDRWADDCKFPILGANIIDTATGKTHFKPYEVLERDGVKIVVLGMITPAIPVWLSENLWKGLRFDDMEETARKWMKIIREKEKPDLVIGIFHAGQDALLMGGKMIVPHYAPVDAPEGAFCNIEKDRMENTPDFFDLNLKLNYTFVLHDHIKLQLNAGVQNIFNSFQKDLDKGEFRDSGYFYGPTQPRTFFIGFKIMN